MTLSNKSYYKDNHKSTDGRISAIKGQFLGIVCRLKLESKMNLFYKLKLKNFFMSLLDAMMCWHKVNLFLWLLWSVLNWWVVFFRLEMITTCSSLLMTAIKQWVHYLLNNSLLWVNSFLKLFSTLMTGKDWSFRACLRFWPQLRSSDQ